MPGFVKAFRGLTGGGSSSAADSDSDSDSDSGTSPSPSSPSPSSSSGGGGGGHVDISTQATQRRIERAPNPHDALPEPATVPLVPARRFLGLGSDEGEDSGEGEGEDEEVGDADWEPAQLEFPLGALLARVLDADADGGGGDAVFAAHAAAAAARFDTSGSGSGSGSGSSGSSRSGLPGGRAASNPQLSVAAASGRLCVPRARGAAVVDVDALLAAAAEAGAESGSGDEGGGCFVPGQAVLGAVAFALPRFAGGDNIRHCAFLADGRGNGGGGAADGAGAAAAGGGGAGGDDGGGGYDLAVAVDDDKHRITVARVGVDEAHSTAFLDIPPPWQPKKNLSSGERSAPSQLLYAQGVDSFTDPEDGSPVLVIADAANHRIQLFDCAGLFPEGALELKAKTAEPAGLSLVARHIRDLYADALPPKSTDIETWIWSATVSPDGSRAFAVVQSQPNIIFDARSGEPLLRLEEFKSFTIGDNACFDMNNNLYFSQGDYLHIIAADLKSRTRIPAPQCRGVCFDHMRRRIFLLIRQNVFVYTFGSRVKAARG